MSKLLSPTSAGVTSALGPVSAPPLQADEGMGQPGATAPMSTGRVNSLDPEFYLKHYPSSQIQWSSIQQPGTLLWSAPTHPFSTNKFVRYAMQMYNVWGGNIDWEMQIAGTNFQAGKLMLVRLPPHIQPSSLSTVTEIGVYPCEYIDVRTTEPINWTAIDQRKVMYHDIKDSVDIRNVDDIGGFSALYVYLPLRAAANGQESVTIATLAKLSTDFCISQLRGDRISRTPFLPGQLGAYSALLGFNSPVHHPGIPRKTLDTLVLAPASETIATYGFYGCRGNDGKLYYTFDHLNGDRATFLPPGVDPPESWYASLVLEATDTDVTLKPEGDRASLYYDIPTAGKVLRVLLDDNTIKALTVVSTEHAVADGTPGGMSWTGIKCTTDSRPSNQKGLVIRQEEFNNYAMSAINEGASFKVQSVESFVRFRPSGLAVTTPMPDIFQSKELSGYLSTLTDPLWPSTEAAIFQLTENATGLPILRLKVYANGVITAPAVTNETTFNMSDFSVQFLQYQSANEPPLAASDTKLLSRFRKYQRYANRR